MSPSFRANHAIYECVLKPDGVRRYEVYKSPAAALAVSSSASASTSGAAAAAPVELVAAAVTFGSKVNGHRGIVHGGVASLLYDDAFGFAYFIATSGMMGYTANLNVNYKTPLPENSEAVIRVFLESIEGRKVKLRARLESKDGTVVYSDATALYIVDRSLTKMKLGPELDKLVAKQVA